MLMSEIVMSRPVILFSRNIGKILFIGSKYPKLILLGFGNKSTGHDCIQNKMGRLAEGQTCSVFGSVLLHNDVCFWHADSTCICPDDKN